MAAIVKEERRSILLFGNLLFPIAKTEELYRHKKLNQHTHSMQWANPQALDKSPILATPACRTRSRSCRDEKHFPLLAAEIR